MFGQRFYRGRHRGVYRPNPHWAHRICYPDGMCSVTIRDVLIRPYAMSGNDLRDVWLKLMAGERWIS